MPEVPGQRQEPKDSTRSGLSFLALLSFVTSFVSARAFATLNPHVVVVTGGIHFHHFWYGLVLVVAAGWAAIVIALPTHKRIYAVVFGLGTGLIGDEVGLLLTFGDYNSSLTYFFFVIVVALSSMALLLVDRKQIEADVIGLAIHERTLLAGIVVMGVSSLAFGAGLYPYGAAILVTGLVVAVVGVFWRLRTQRAHAAAV